MLTFLRLPWVLKKKKPEADQVARIFAIPRFYLLSLFKICVFEIWPKNILIYSEWYINFYFQLLHDGSILLLCFRLQ